jgi:ADP-ribose pyrophosphatase YjhB (NUDIX family)
VDRATKIKQQALTPLQAQDAVNTFQWSKALLNIESPTGLAVVQRFEADSKFFRCFVVVLLLLLAAWPLQGKWPLADVPVVVAMLVLALWRYMEQRFKATNQAYWSVITLTAHGGKTQMSKRDLATIGPTHAGGVVFRIRRGRIEYLLVEANGDPPPWVLPTGHIEEGEQPRETAVREVHKQTGAWGRMVEDLGDVSYRINDAAVTVRFYLMQFIARGLRTDTFRQRTWLSLSQATAQASHPETRHLLHDAEQRQRTRPRGPSG